MPARPRQDHRTGIGWAEILRIEAQMLARLTGWDINEIRRRQGIVPRAATDDRYWWQKIWK